MSRGDIHAHIGLYVFRLCFQKYAWRPKSLGPLGTVLGAQCFHNKGISPGLLREHYESTGERGMRSRYDSLRVGSHSSLRGGRHGEGLITGKNDAWSEIWFVSTKSGVMFVL